MKSHCRASHSWDECRALRSPSEGASPLASPLESALESPLVESPLAVGGVIGLRAEPVGTAEVPVGVATEPELRRGGGGGIPRRIRGGEECTGKLWLRSKSMPKSGTLHFPSSLSKFFGIRLGFPE